MSCVITSASFYDLPMLKPVAYDAQHWLVCDRWLGPMIDSKRRLVIDAGFETDGASIPRLFWTTIGHPFSRRFLGPALAHDALYDAELVTRATADWLFLEWLQLAGVVWTKRNRMWLAVRVGGGVCWGRHTEESIGRARAYCHLEEIE